MSWRDRLRQASFRGAEFFVEDHDAAFGRRTVVHEYPGRDKPYVEDLGRKARPFTIAAYVLGPDYDIARDRLILELEKAGPGKLVHPYLGELIVTLTDGGRLSETTREGGMARFSLTFIESGEATFPTSVINTKAGVGDAADAALAAVEQDFADRFSVDAAPEFVSGSAIDLAVRALDQLESAGGGGSTDVEALADFLPAIEDVSSEIEALVREPAQLAARFTALVKQVTGVIDDPESSLRALRDLFGFGADEPVVAASTPSRSQQADNQAALTGLVQQAAVIEAVRASADMQFEAFDDAVSVRTDLADELERLMGAATSDAVFGTLADLRAAMVRDITARGADLARVVSYTPIATLPALVLAYDLYGEAGRDEEIVARNRVRHPGFVPGGRALELLTDG